MAKRDYYEILGVDKSADTSTIKRAYRGLAMKYHPDRNPEDDHAAENMKEINEAYAVLSDAQKRQVYDTYGHAGLESYTQDDLFHGVDFSSLFHEFGLRDLFGFGFGGSIFDSLFGGRRTASRRGPQKGADLRYDLAVTLEEVAAGTEKTVALPQPEPCSTCRGTGAEPDGLSQCEACSGSGQIVNEQRSGYSVFRQISVCGQCHGQGEVIKEPCQECTGRGIIEKSQEITVRIPAGADTGYRIRVAGEGKKDADVPGDLYIVLNVEQHPIFERHGDDIYLQQEITFTTAALGGQIDVPSLNSRLELEVPEETQTGSVFRIMDAGMTHVDGLGKGDEYVIVKVVTPTKLSRRERALLKELVRLREKSPDGQGEADDEGETSPEP